MTDAGCPTWRKSSYSSGTGNCVEVAVADGSVRVRDSKRQGHGPVLEFSPAEWAAFLRLAKTAGLSR